jgi:hypothetical protein
MNPPPPLKAKLPKSNFPYLTWRDVGIVPTKTGDKYLFTAITPSGWWEYWRENKLALKEAGISCGKDKAGTWHITYWGEPNTPLSPPSIMLSTTSLKKQIPSSNRTNIMSSNISYTIDPECVTFVALKRVGFWSFASKRFKLINDSYTKMHTGDAIEILFMLERSFPLDWNGRPNAENNPHKNNINNLIRDLAFRLNRPITEQTFGGYSPELWDRVSPMMQSILRVMERGWNEGATHWACIAPNTNEIGRLSNYDPVYI